MSITPPQTPAISAAMGMGLELVDPEIAGVEDGCTGGVDGATFDANGVELVGGSSLRTEYFAVVPSTSVGVTDTAEGATYPEGHSWSVVKGTPLTSMDVGSVDEAECCSADTLSFSGSV